VPSTSGTAGPSAQRKRGIDDTHILRFQESERLLHWAIAIPFLICWITALILILVYNPYPMRPYRSVFAVVHRMAGVCLVLLPALVMLTKRDFKIHLYNIRNAWIWSLDDLKWLFLMGIAAINKKIALPQQGKFNAAEKVNFILVMAGWPVFGVTGIMMLVQNTPWLPWLVHVGMAFLVSPTMLGHIYMATINPETRTGISGMISGYVNRQWAKHHYGLWYLQHAVPPKPDHIKHQDRTDTHSPISLPDPGSARQEVAPLKETRPPHLKTAP
jgi:formate dehydrogenase gamma subunit